MKGFSLIELLIYIVILATILVLTTSFLWVVIFGNIKESSFQEVQYNGRFALAKMRQEIQKATGVNSASGNFLSLEMAEPNLNPTVFQVINDRLTIGQGGSGPYELMSDQVKVTNLQFIDLSYLNTPGTIKIEMTISHVNSGSRMEYQASIDLTSSVSLAPGGAVVPPPSLEILRPQGYIDTAMMTTNPDLAYDGANGNTWATTKYGATADPSITFHTWQLTAKSYNNLVLKYRYHADKGNDDTYAIAYSIDGGSSWIDLISPTGAKAPDTIISINLSATQDLSLFQVKIYTERIKGDDKKSLYTRDIWTEGSF